MNATEKPKPASGKFAHWTGPETGQEHVLVPAEHFQKLQAVIDGVIRRASWVDPAMDVYEQLRKKP
jgi:hypothetical protein